MLQVQNVSTDSGFDASLRWSRPRNILSRYLSSKEIYESPTVPASPRLFFDLSHRYPHWQPCVLIRWTIIISIWNMLIYLFIFRSDSFVFFLFCCCPLKSVCQLLFPRRRRRQETAPERTRAAKCHRGRTLILDWFHYLFSHRWRIGAWIFVYFPRRCTLRI